MVFNCFMEGEKLFSGVHLSKAVIRARCHVSFFDDENASFRKPVHNAEEFFFCEGEKSSSSKAMYMPKIAAKIGDINVVSHEKIVLEGRDRAMHY